MKLFARGDKTCRFMRITSPGGTIEREIANLLIEIN